MSARHAPALNPGEARSWRRNGAMPARSMPGIVLLVGRRNMPVNQQKTTQSGIRFDGKTMMKF
jgi:hypothetical protein